MTFLTFSELGNTVFSNVSFNGIAGVSRAPITFTGASRYSKHSSTMRPAMLCAKVLDFDSSVKTP